MLANTSPSIMLLLLVSILFLIIAKGALMLKENSFHGQSKPILISLCCILIAVASWIFNIGWLRFVLTILLLPFFHAAAFFLVNFFASKYMAESKKLKTLNLWFIISYLAYYVFLPDGGDYGEMYFLFGLIHSDKFSGPAQIISTIAFIAHIVLMIKQLFEIRKVKRDTSAPRLY